MKLPPNSLVASGPVIIEDGKVLLNRERKPYGVSPWFFPGGEYDESDANLEETCIREAREEMGIDIEIVRPLRTIIKKQCGDNNAYAVLVHYLAKRIGEIKPGRDIVEWGWHDIHNLPENCAPNVTEIIKDLL